MLTTTRYLGSWTLPSGNSCDVYVSICEETFAGEGHIEWAKPLSPSWPASDLHHWRHITLPDIARAVGELTGKRVMGVQL